MIIRKFIFMHTHTHTHTTRTWQKFQSSVLCFFMLSLFFFFFLSKHPPPSTISYSYMAPHSLLFFIFHGLNMNQFNIVKGCIHEKALYELIVYVAMPSLFTDDFHHPPKFTCLQQFCCFFYLFSSFLSWGIFRKFNFSQFKYLFAYYETHIYFILIPKPNNNNKTHPRVPPTLHTSIPLPPKNIDKSSKMLQE